MAASPFRVSSGVMLPSFGHFPNIMYLCVIVLCKVWEKARCGIAVATPYEANFLVVIDTQCTLLQKSKGSSSM